MIIFILLAQELIRIKPEDEKGWISRAFALRHLDRDDLVVEQAVLLGAGSALRASDMPADLPAYDQLYPDLDVVSECRPFFLRRPLRPGCPIDTESRTILD